MLSSSAGIKTTINKHFKKTKMVLKFIRDWNEYPKVTNMKPSFIAANSITQNISKMFQLQRRSGQIFCLQCLYLNSTHKFVSEKPSSSFSLTSLHSQSVYTHLFLTQRYPADYTALPPSLLLSGYTFEARNYDPPKLISLGSFRSSDLLDQPVTLRPPCAAGNSLFSVNTTKGNTAGGLWLSLLQL